MAWVAPCSEGSCDRVARKNTRSLEYQQLETCEGKSYGGDLSSSPFPLTTALSRRVLIKSSRTFGGQVADNAMIGTSGKSWRSVYSFW